MNIHHEETIIFSHVGHFNWGNPSEWEVALEITIPAWSPERLLVVNSYTSEEEARQHSINDSANPPSEGILEFLAEWQRKIWLSSNKQRVQALIDWLSVERNAQWLDRIWAIDRVKSLTRSAERMLDEVEQLRQLYVKDIDNNKIYSINHIVD